MMCILYFYWLVRRVYVYGNNLLNDVLDNVLDDVLDTYNLHYLVL